MAMKASPIRANRTAKRQPKPPAAPRSRTTHPSKRQLLSSLRTEPTGKQGHRTGDITERKHLEDVERERARVLKQQQIGLCDLAKHDAIYTGNLEEALRIITETGSRVLGVERASIWRLNEQGTAMELLNLYERTLNRHITGFTLAAQDYPSYFQAIAHEGYAIAAHDAHADVRTRELSQSYLTPLGIGAMLDAPVRRRGHVIGALCHEHVGGP